MKILMSNRINAIRLAADSGARRRPLEYQYAPSTALRQLSTLQGDGRDEFRVDRWATVPILVAVGGPIDRQDFLKLP